MQTSVFFLVLTKQGISNLVALGSVCLFEHPSLS